jgi:hypothetical protein
MATCAKRKLPISHLGNFFFFLNILKVKYLKDGVIYIACHILMYVKNVLRIVNTPTTNRNFKKSYQVAKKKNLFKNGNQSLLLNLYLALIRNR